MNRVVLATVVMAGYGALATSDRQAGRVTTPAPGLAPQSLWEHFNGPWPGGVSPDHLFRLDGDWIGTGGNLFQVANSTILPNTVSRGGRLRLLVPGGQTRRPFRAAEIESIPGSPGTRAAGLGYGYYEASLQVTGTPGVCDSFFWIEAPGYGPREWDIEFLTDESWTAAADWGTVHFTLHPSNRMQAVRLPFNPSKAPHRYGFLWQASLIVFTVDGRMAARFEGAELSNPPSGGYLMANEWTGRAAWGGGPPRHDAASLYDWIRFEAAVTSIPDW